MSLNIVPMFVFDGPKRPTFKRNKRLHTGPARNQQLAKDLIEHFGFPVHNAPGEAEAECAFLQKEGIVDAVLTEDSDALMFGCGVTFRNWSASKGGAVTHIHVYDLEKIKEERGLTPAGMVLVALMSGADYIPEGVERCGIKTALEAARGGWGERLAQLDPTDDAGIYAWKEDLLWELKRNENKTFRRKHPSIQVKDEFPQREAWGFYKTPLISCRTEADLERLKDGIFWNGGPSLQHLREYTRHYFQWNGRIGAEKFIRVMAPAMLVWRLRRDSPESLVELINAIHSRREHASTDNVFELRLSAIPGEIVPIDLSSEEFDQEGAVIDMETVTPEDDVDGDEDAIKKKNWEPFVLDRYWVPEILVRYRLSGLVDDWDEAKEKKKAKLANPKGRKKGADMEKEKLFMAQYLTVTKSAKTIEAPKTKNPPNHPEEITISSQSSYTSSQKTITGKASKPTSTRTRNTARKTTKDTTTDEPEPTKPTRNANPWTLAKRNPHTMGISPPERCRYSELGVYGASADKVTKSTAKTVYDVDEGTWNTIGDSSTSYLTAPELQSSSSHLPSSTNPADAQLDTRSTPPITSEEYFYDANEPFDEYDECYGASTLAYEPKAPEVSLPKPLSPARSQQSPSKDRRESSFYGSDSIWEAVEALEDYGDMLPPATTDSPNDKKRNDSRSSLTKERRTQPQIRRRSESPLRKELGDDGWPVVSTQNVYRVDERAPTKGHKPEFSSIVLSSDDAEADSMPNKTVNRVPGSTGKTSSQSRPSISGPSTESPSSSPEQIPIPNRLSTPPPPTKKFDRQILNLDTQNPSSEEDEEQELPPVTPIPKDLFSNPNDPRLSYITMTRGQHSATPKRRSMRRGQQSEEPATPTPAVRTRNGRAGPANTSRGSSRAPSKPQLDRSNTSSTDPEVPRRSMKSTRERTQSVYEDCLETLEESEALEDCVGIHKHTSTTRKEKPAKPQPSKAISSYFKPSKAAETQRSTRSMQKKNVQLRKSLNVKGQWAEISDEDLDEVPETLRQSTYVGVDVVDLTGED